MAKEQDPQKQGDELQFPEGAGEDVFGSDSFLGEDSGVGGQPAAADETADFAGAEAPDLEEPAAEVPPAEEAEESKFEKEEPSRKEVFLARLTETDVFTVMLGLSVLALLIAIVILLWRWGGYEFRTSPDQVRAPAAAEAAPPDGYAALDFSGPAPLPPLA